MDSGKFNVKTHLYAPTIERNEFGSQETVYSPKLRVNANVYQKSGNRVDENSAIQWTYIKQFRYRNTFNLQLSELDDDWLIKTTHDIYRILNIDRDSDRRYIVIEAEKIKASSVKLNGTE